MGEAVSRATLLPVPLSVPLVSDPLPLGCGPERREPGRDPRGAFPVTFELLCTGDEDDRRLVLEATRGMGLQGA